ncbi:hypothetical protein SAMN05444360_10156 [Chryseobacterium carnipullorum]|uniref:hypothetical protein n=1 Tax=Chryseobacterium carnipullorum TaxID=1124835 RepID=UPI000918F01A|nr:hypothetical protein [Chryseobacterium carnipullorum]SHL29373.1 hypothetical protein SAMN05444360_10156 [Chryseobacterium carnipullorum]
MLPQSQIRYNRKIKIDELVFHEVNKPNSFWAITWLGKTCWKEERMRREIILTNIENRDFDFARSDKSIKVYVPEEKTIHYSLGTYFGYNGDFLENPKCDRNGITRLENIEVNPLKDYHINGIHGSLKGTGFPLYFEKNDMIYKGAGYYSVKHGDLTIIIPGHVILSYFYYLSTLQIYHLIYGTFEDGLDKKMYYTENNIPLFFYNSSIIRYQEASEISKYKLIKGGYESMARIHSDFYASLNQSWNTERKAYLTSKIPFNELVKLDVIGKRISKDKFLVFAIENFNLLDSTGRNFISEKFEMKDLSDHSTLNEETEDPENYTQQIEIPNPNPRHTDRPTNHNFNVRNVFLDDGRKRFYEIPENKKQLKTEQKKQYVAEDRVFHNVDEISENIRNHNGRNNTARANFFDNNTFDYIKALFAAVTILESKNIECSYIFIDPAPFKNSSYTPIKSDRIAPIIMVSIYYNDFNYCLIVSKNTNNKKGRMALLKCSEKYYRFERERDNLVEQSLIHMISKFGDLDWDKIRDTQELKSIISVSKGLSLRHLFNHNKLETAERTAESLALKIKKKLK